ncbi:Putative transcriptional regulatory protein, partial [Tolypocladium paradoxum]
MSGPRDAAAHCPRIVRRPSAALESSARATRRSSGCGRHPSSSLGRPDGRAGPPIARLPRGKRRVAGHDTPRAVSEELGRVADGEHPAHHYPRLPPRHGRAANLRLACLTTQLLLQRIELESDKQAHAPEERLMNRSTQARRTSEEMLMLMLVQQLGVPVSAFAFPATVNFWLRRCRTLSCRTRPSSTSSFWRGEAGVVKPRGEGWR